MKITKKKNHTQQLQLIAYARRTFKRYQGLEKRDKGKFLTQVVSDFGGHRKSIIRLYKRLLCGNKVQRSKENLVSVAECSNIIVLKKKRGRKTVYQDANVIWWLQTLWIAMNQVSEKLMYAMIPEWLKKSDDPGLTEAIKVQLLAMSASTIERLIRSYKKENQRKLFCTTKAPRGKDLMIRIPTRQLNFQAPSCGFIEGDTVAHCGGTLAGAFAWTLNIVDHKSLWTEQCAFISNTAEHVVSSVIEMRRRLPFPIISFHSDGGSEFINKLLYEYFQNPKDFITQTHGRAYKKNDQARVEQKNFTHVRQIFGYERIATQRLIFLMNDIYSNEWRLLNNFFTSVRKQTSKIRMGSKFKRTFDKPKTPFQRIRDDKTISVIEKEKLTRVYATLNPFELKKSLNKKLKQFQIELKQQNIPTDEDLKEAA